MAFLLQAVDESENVLFDFNSPDGTNNPHSLRTFCFAVDLGSVSGTPVHFEPDAIPGGYLVKSRDELVQMSWRQGFVANGTVDQMYAAASEMFSVLKAGGRLRMRGTDTSAMRYIDFTYGQPGGLLRGQEGALYKLFGQLHEPDGLPIAVIRQPYLRLAELDSDTNKLTNPFLVLDADGDGRPDGWTWSSVVGLANEIVEAATESYRFDIASSDVSRTLAQIVSDAAEGEVWTGSYDGKVFGIGQLGLRIQYLDAADTILVHHDLTPLKINTEFERIVFTAPASPVNTAKVRMAIWVDNSSASGTGTYWVRRAQLELGSAATTFVGSSEVIPMDPANGGRTYLVHNAGDADAPFHLKLKGDAGSEIQSIRLASLSALEDGGKSLTRYLNGPRVLQAEDHDFTGTGTDAGPGGVTAGAIVTDVEASGGQAVEWTTTSDQWRRFERFEVTDTDVLEGLRGTFEARLRLKGFGKKDFEFQMRWADSLQEPALVASLPVRHNVNIDNLATFGYVEKTLGSIALPTEGTLDGLAIEIWARDRDALADQNLRFDCLTLVPTEQQTILSLSLVGRAVFDTGTLTNVNLEDKLGANRWRVTWRYSVRSPSSGYKAQFEVERVSVDLVVHQKAHATEVTNKTASLEFDSDAATVYTAEAATIAGTGTLTVHEVIVERVVTLAENEYIESDPDVGVDRVRAFSATDRIIGDVSPGGPTPFWLPPGTSIIIVEASEPRIGGLYSELASNIARNPTLSHTYSPRVR